jgi:hypothetical protein
VDKAGAEQPRLVNLRAVLGSRRQVAITVTALLSALSALSACSGGPAPRALPRLSADRAAGSHRTPPARRAAAAGGSTSERASAVAVVRRYFRVLNRLSRDMNATGLATMFAADCPCQAQVRAVRAAAARAEHYVGTAHVNIARPSVESPTRASVLVNVDVSRSGLETAGGAMVTSVPARHHLQRIFQLEKGSRGWLVYRIDAA